MNTQLLLVGDDVFQVQTYDEAMTLVDRFDFQSATPDEQSQVQFLPTRAD